MWKIIFLPILLCLVSCIDKDVEMGEPNKEEVLNEMETPEKRITDFPPVDVLKEFPAYAKPVIIANVKKQTQEMSTISSGYGGVFWGTSNEGWPIYDGRFMVAALSIRVDELPSVPDHLEGIALLNIFIDHSEHPEEDGATIIRTYPSLDGLQPIDIPTKEIADFHSIAWKATTDYPDGTMLEYKLLWDEIKKDFDDHERRRAIEGQYWAQFEEHHDEIQQSFPNHSGLKIGGWPTMIQVSPIAFLADEDPGYLAQLDSTVIYSFYDDGIGYLMKWDGKFVMSGWTSH